jgi:asparaginyl-tRNA synthetase
MGTAMTQKRLKIKEALRATEALEGVVIYGWVRTRRDSKEFSFMEVNDGSCLANMQVVVDAGIDGYEDIQEYTTGSAVSVTGMLVESLGKGQKWEVKASCIELIGKSEESYPLQKKRHSLEYLREISHLRPRSNLFGAVFRVRSRLAYAIHQFFQDKGFVYVHTPLITASDCEGAGEMFRVSTLDPMDPPKTGEGSIDYEQDFASSG